MATRRLGKRGARRRRYNRQLYSVTGNRRQMWSTGATVCIMPGTPLPQIGGLSFDHIHTPVTCGDAGEELWLLDTGAPTSIIGPDYRKCFTPLSGDQPTFHILDVRGEQTLGILGTCPLRIEAKLGGQDLLLDAEVMLIEEWSGYPLLGLGGALGQIRFAVDPLGGEDGYGSMSFALLDRRP